ncbi:DUF3102 domain-containing protein [Methylobacterium flocculans]|uniref:DUF3102 domain-containing protein n=1 Tax=Methylobacterium flocculans TaxID=2984843 RepID=UPI0021F2EC87|nr:DUF3102 domain-containing protein [Methylobacterium sp. FF17]
MSKRMGSNIAGAINAAHAGVEAAKREGARYAVECGRLLGEAKATVPHGGWDAWLRLNTTVSPRTAQLYMRIARHVESDPAKAQRVAGLSVREAAAEATVTKRALRPEPANPLSVEEQAWLTELMDAWAEAKDRPDFKEAFVREIHRRGEITLKERNRLIKAAYFKPGVTDADREIAARNVALMLKAYIPKGKLSELMQKCIAENTTGEDLAIALGDAIEARQIAANG